MLKAQKIIKQKFIIKVLNSFVKKILHNVKLRCTLVLHWNDFDESKGNC